jgi:hypothetical protein
MQTFVVRLFLADDLPGFRGTVERPGSTAIPFHDEVELIRRLMEIVGSLALEGTGNGEDPPERRSQAGQPAEPG